MTRPASPSLATPPVTEVAAAPARAGLADWVLRLVPAAILGQTLAFKFAGAPEPVWIFTQLGVEPWGRLATAGLELLAVLMLIVPRLSALGAVLTVGIMAGAVGSHLTVLGVEVMGDGGALFAMGLVALVCAYLHGWRHRAELPLVGSLLRD